MEGVLPQWRSTEAEGTQDRVPDPVWASQGNAALKTLGPGFKS